MGRELTAWRKLNFWADSGHENNDYYPLGGRRTNVYTANHVDVQIRSYHRRT